MDKKPEDTDARPAEPHERLILDVDAADLAEVSATARSLGCDVTEVVPDGFEPVTIITLIIFGSLAALGSVETLMERRRGGQVIDTRSQPARLYRDRSLQYGLILILAEDGTVELQTFEPSSMFPTLVDATTKAVGEMASSTTDAVANAVASVAEAVAAITTRGRHALDADLAAQDDLSGDVDDA